MTTIVRGLRPPELERLLERRRLSGSDRFDEVWEGRYVVAPDPHSIALQQDQSERDRSDVLGMSTAEVSAAIDWPELGDAVG